MSSLSSQNNHVDDDNGDGDNITMAVKFLKHSLVKNSDRERQVQFLKGKGLSDAEIDKAFSILEKTTDVPDSKQSTGWISDTFQKFAFTVGFFAFVNYLYKSFVLPYVKNELNKNEKVNEVFETVNLLRNDISQLSKELKSNALAFNSKFEELNSGSSKQNQNQFQTNDIANLKSEIETLKSLMLSSKEFPSVPFAPVPKRVPAWQLAKEDNVSDTDAVKEDISESLNNNVENESEEDKSSDNIEKIVLPSKEE